jgi:hypothetical protein
MADKQRAYSLIDQLGRGQLDAVVRLLETIAVHRVCDRKQAYR